MNTATETVSDSLREALRQTARACRILNMEGHADITLGHLSLRDLEGRGFWLKRSGIGLGEVRDVADFVLLDGDGKRLSGDGQVHIEWPIHAQILSSRPDVRVVGHTHPFHAAAFSATGAPLRPLTHAGAMIGGTVPYFTVTSALADTPGLGRAVAESLGDASAVLMRNHGVTFCGGTIAEATLVGIFVEKACKTQLLLAASNLPWRWPEGEELEAKHGKLMAPALIEAFWAFYNRELDRAEGLRGATDPD